MKFIAFITIIFYSIQNGNAAVLSSEEFMTAVTVNGYSRPREDQYKAFNNGMPASAITTKREAIMFLAQILVESGGLRYKKEIACAKTGCPGRYDSSVGVEGKNYYGRGYIQLTHSYNYKAASLALYGDDRLIKNPDLVSDTEEGAWDTAFWYWKAFVHSKPGIAEGHFGVSTLAINGGLCKHNLPGGHSRFRIYKKILDTLPLNETANETGCYN